jgi:cyclophilin family peptidyl-prolyl cis-trans isomerase
MKRLLGILLLLCCINAFAAKPKHKYVRITTDLGECMIMLYNETPLHRDNFLKLSKAHFYDGTLFHRVIKNFMIQGGDPDSRHAKPAAREDNPAKASSGCQFYIVQGKTFTEEQLEKVEEKRLKFKLPDYQREVYKTIGGAPHLDHNYTVFGQVVKGLELVDQIGALLTDPNDRPNKDIHMKITVLKRHQAKKLEKELALANRQRVS